MPAPQTDPTPTYDELIAELGDPVPRPAVDRSYARVLAEASAAPAAE